MDATAEAFWEDYRLKVGRLLQPIGQEDGCSAQEIAEAERRLGRPMPRLLREFYLLVGERDDINQAFEQLLPLKEIALTGGVLVFYGEAQAVFLWGVVAHDPACDDPAVLRAHYVTEDFSGLVWEPYQERLSDFLTEMLLVQAAYGAMPYSGSGTVSGERLARAELDWDVVETGGRSNVRWLMRDGQLIMVGSSDETSEPSPTYSVIVAGRTVGDIRSIGQTLDIDWSPWSDPFSRQDS